VVAPASVGGYRLLGALGEGGMGTVYEGEEIATGRRVAVKLIRPEFADSQDAVERFRREGQLAGTIAHPRCVFVFAADEEAGRPYIVMERMPGATLASLVEKDGPLKPREAVVRILDVIEGLQEAHRCGVIHRDVKPSNCFIDADNRVKIGDFGLSKALATDGRLTQSGAFLGTLLYASPEQIRNDRVDQQADVYSVAATLYFLLTGRAPFQGDDSDAAAALARTLTDPITPIRQRRREVPTTLDAVVQRGLERVRQRRWRNLEEFRQALLPFVRDQRSWALLGWRVGAYLLDAVAIFGAGVLLGLGEAILHTEPTLTDSFGNVVTYLLNNGLPVLYFFVPEWLFGGSPGKLLFRLRVRTALHNERLGLIRTFLRTLLWFALYNAPSWTLIGLAYAVAHVIPGDAEDRNLIVGLLSLCTWPMTLLAGVVLLGCTMRRSNGFRALHDVVSGTMVIRLPSTRGPRLLAGVVAPPTPTPMPGHAPDRLGAFVVRGVMCVTGDDQLLLGEDGGLHRRVWLWARPRAASELPGARRDLSRTTRPRWLATGREGGRRWDAFVASSGCLLTDVRPAGQRFAWTETLPVLEDLADELAAACADGTLPRLLSFEQVWIDAAGRVQLLDLPLRFPRDLTEEHEPEQRALNFLRQAAARMLEGQSRGPQDNGPIRAPLPDQPASVLRRLMDSQWRETGHGFRTVRAFRAALRTAREAPAEVTRRRRTIHLLTLVPLLGVGLFWLLAASYFMTLTTYESNETADACAKEALQLLREPNDGNVALTNDNINTQEGLENKRKLLAQRRELLLGSHLVLRPLLMEMVASSGSPSNAAATVGQGQAPRVRIRQLEGVVDGELGGMSGFRMVWMLSLLIPLLAGATLWTLGAGITRGGVGQWLAGVRLVQADGRRAARWRCVWRALLVCLPITALLGVSMGVEGWRLTGGGEGDLWAWLVCLTWWSGLAMIALFGSLALWSPNRGLHDRLAGTYLVPREW
jgi:hypothetical protein